MIKKQNPAVHLRGLKPDTSRSGGAWIEAREMTAYLQDRLTNTTTTEWQLAGIQANWPQIAGPLAKHTRPMQIHNDTMLVHCNHPAYVQEVTLLKGELLKRIKQTIPTIHHIRAKYALIDRQSDPALEAKEPAISDANLISLQAILDQI